MNPKLPVAILDARGKSHHLTKDIRMQRLATEVKPMTTDIDPPRTLTTKRMRERFVEVATLLDTMGVWDTADTDELARYVMASEAYDLIMGKFVRACRSGDLDLIKELAPRQKELHRQAHELASSLGLNVTSRARIVVPPKVSQSEEVDF